MATMRIPADPADAGDAAVAAFGEDRLLLEEANHRVLNELACAIGALRLVRSARGSRTRWRLLGEAIERLEAFAAAQRLLSGPTPGSVNVSRRLEDLCRALVAARPGVRAASVRMHVPDLWVDGATARRILLVAAELVANALRHALAGRAGVLEVSVSLDGTDAVLVVADDGPGLAAGSAAAGTGLGTPIVRELVARGEGALSCDSGPRGTAWRVALPLDMAAMAKVRPHG